MSEQSTIIMEYMGITACITMSHTGFMVNTYSCKGDAIIIKRFREELEKDPFGHFFGPRVKSSTEHFTNVAYAVSQSIEGLTYRLNPPSSTKSEIMGGSPQVRTASQMNRELKREIKALKRDLNR